MSDDPPPSSTWAISFTLGSRRLLSIEREVATLAFPLESILAGRVPAIPSLSSVEGLRVLSVPPVVEQRLRKAMPGFLIGARDEYSRRYIDMAGSYDEYLARFSGKTRSTLRRKRRKFEQASGGALDLRDYRTPEELERFAQLAVPLSRRTYQARLLDAGLPESDDAMRDMRQLAAEDRVRAFLLFLRGEPVAYLYLPVRGETLVYAHLGHDPSHAGLSPGTVLQLAALELLFAEQRFRYFDFTEGDGEHKALFATDAVTCASFLMMYPSLANRTVFAAHAAFNRVVAAGKALARRSGVEALARRLLRT